MELLRDCIIFVAGYITANVVTTIMLRRQDKVEEIRIPHNKHNPTYTMKIESYWDEPKKADPKKYHDDDLASR